MDIYIGIGTSIFRPTHFGYSSGLSIIYLDPPSSKIGVAFSATLLHCAQCNTPIAEVAGGSLIIKSKHHSQRHTTAIAISELQNLAAIQYNN